MNWSLTELQAMSLKAARGSGMSWGMAEEASRATRRLASLHLPGPELLVALLTRNDNVPHGAVCPMETSGDWTARGGALCPISAGAAFSDQEIRFQDGGTVQLKSVSCPLLLLPFVETVARKTGIAMECRWGATALTVWGDGVVIDGDTPWLMTSTPVDVEIRRAADDPIGTHCEPSSRAELPDETATALTRFAHRTYAPATEESRLAGAGAGLSDND